MSKIDQSPRRWQTKERYNLKIAYGAYMKLSGKASRPFWQCPKENVCLGLPMNTMCTFLDAIASPSCLVPWVRWWVSEDVFRFTLLALVSVLPYLPYLHWGHGGMDMVVKVDMNMIDMDMADMEDPGHGWHGWHGGHWHDEHDGSDLVGV